MIYARVDYQTYQSLVEVSEKIGSSLSEAIRQSIIVMHGLLSNAPEINIGRVVIQNPSVNINYVKQEAVQLVKNDNVLRLKREIDRLNHELEKALSENIELRKQIDELQKQLEQSRNNSRCDDVYRKLQSLQRELDGYKFYVAVAVACIEREDCDKRQLLTYLKEKVQPYEKPELVNALVRQWVRS